MTKRVPIRDVARAGLRCDGQTVILEDVTKHRRERVPDLHVAHESSPRVRWLRRMGGTTAGRGASAWSRRPRARCSRSRATRNGVRPGRCAASAGTVR